MSIKLQLAPAVQYISINISSVSIEFEAVSAVPGDVTRTHLLE